MKEDSPERYRRVKGIFAGARDLPVADRGAFLDEACGSDKELREELEELLSCDDDRTDDALDLALMDDGDAGVRIDVALPREIANYRILGLCGSGGMGTVYEAEQDSPRRRVALKVIQSGAMRKDLLRRFKREADILGRLQHPGIAQVFDAGEFEQDGVVRPYFTMEFIEGEALLDFANSHQFDIAARVDLFLLVCDAVHYAHENGIIHRDLKPDNVLVVETTGATTAAGSCLGQPKVLDFGVARFIDDDLSVTMATGTGQLLGSVPYMSPEQAGAESGQIDVRSDVYGLGVMLFELLTGELPYEVRRRALPDAIDVILHGEPQRLGSVDPGLRGDLETIVGKCLEKDPARRYYSTAALANDLRLYQDHKPITARPPSTWYQISKFARRNRAIVGGVIAAVVALSVGLIVAIVFAMQLSRSEQSARINESRAESAAYRANLTAAAAVSGHDPEQARRTLDEVPEGMRGWEWNLLSARLQTKLLEFGVGSFEVVAIDGGRLVITHDRGGEVRVWETETGTQVRALTAPGDVSRIAATPDGSLLVLGLQNGAIVATNANNGNGEFETWLEANGEPVQAVAVTRAGHRIAVHRGAVLRCGAPGASGTWKTQTVGAARKHPSSLAFSADESVLTLYNAYTTAFHDSRTLEFLRRSPHETYGPSCHAASRDGKWVAIGCEQRQISVIDAETLETVRILRGHHDSIRGVAFDEEGRLLSIAAKSIRVWDVLAGREVAVLPISRCTDATFVQGGRVISCNGDGIQVWDLDAQRARVLGEHDRYAYEVAFSGDSGLLASHGMFGDLMVWDVADGRMLSAFNAKVLSSPLFDAAGERIAFVGWTQSHVFSWIGGKPVVLPHPFSFHHMRDETGLVIDEGRSLSPRREALSIWRTEHVAGGATRAHVDGVALDLSAPTGTPDTGLGPHPRLTIGYLMNRGFEGVMAEILVINGEVSGEDVVRIETYLAQRREGRDALLPPLSSATEVVAHFRASDETVVRDAQGHVHAWRGESEFKHELVATGYPKQLIRFKPARERVPALVESDESGGEIRWMETPLDMLAGANRVTVFWLGRYVTGSHAYSIGTLEMPLSDWPDRDLRELRVSSCRTYGPTHDDQRWVALATRGGGELSIRDVVTGEFLARFEGQYYHNAVHPDGTRLACGDEDGMVQVIDTKTWTIIETLEAHSSHAYAVDWSPDGTRLVTGGNDNVIRIWDAATYELLLELTDHTLYVKDVRFSPDGTMLASASGDSTIRLWDTVPPADRYRQSLANHAVENEVRERVTGWWVESSDPDAAAEAVRAEWGVDDARRRAAMKILAGLAQE